MSFDYLLEIIKSMWEIWKSVAGVIIIIFILYFKYSEKFDKIVRYILWTFSILNRRIEKYALSKEVTYIIRNKFKQLFPWVAEPPIIKIEWGNEERVMLRFSEKKEN